MLTTQSAATSANAHAPTCAIYSQSSTAHTIRARTAVSAEIKSRLCGKICCVVEHLSFVIGLVFGVRPFSIIVMKAMLGNGLYSYGELVPTSHHYQ